MKYFMLKFVIHCKGGISLNFSIKIFCVSLLEPQIIAIRGQYLCFYGEHAAYRVLEIKPTSSMVWLTIYLNLGKVVPTGENHCTLQFF